MNEIIKEIFAPICAGLIIVSIILSFYFGLSLLGSIFVYLSLETFVKYLLLILSSIIVLWIIGYISILMIKFELESRKVRNKND